MEYYVVLLLLIKVITNNSGYSDRITDHLGLISKALKNLIVKSIFIRCLPYLIEETVVSDSLVCDFLTDTLLYFFYQYSH